MASDPRSPHADPMGGLFDFKAMFDAMEMARRNWSAMSLPSSMTPTIDPAELDKRIADLKTVEQWLVLNLNLLRGSVQALELQRATLASLQSFGEAARTAATPSQESPAPAWSGGIDPAAWWQTLQTQFQQVAESALAGAAPAKAAPTAASTATPAAGTRDAPASAPARPRGARAKIARSAPGAADAAGARRARPAR